MTNMDKLYASVAANGPVCVGLDTEFSYLPADVVDYTKTAGENVVEFNRRIIEATKASAGCYKVQIAYYESLGLDGMRAYAETLKMVRATGLPVVAAGGIGSGEAMLAAMALGAEGVQIGTLFALSAESSASEAFKQRCLALDEGGTMLCLKKLSPTRLVRNGLFDKVAEAEARGANSEELRDILGKAASKRGIFEGDTEQGELEIGQIASSVDAIRPAGAIVRQLVEDFRKAQKEVAAFGF